MTNYALVNTDTELVVAGADKTGLTFNGVPGQLVVACPDNTNRTIRAGSPGDVAAPFKIYEVAIATSGAGPRLVGKNDPAFDAVADTVTQTHTMGAAPVTSDGDAYDELQAQAQLQFKAIKRLIKLINDGTFIPGGNLTGPQLKTMFKQGLGG